MLDPLLYQGTAVVFAEVPDEVSLAFNIAGCTHRCDGCHSPDLWEYKGEPLSANFERELDAHPGITCVCFMGGDQNQQELVELCEIANKRGLKTCAWFGVDNFSDVYITLFTHLDYLKLGSWKKYAGPIKSETTNQRMYKLSGIPGHRNIEDITWRFQRKLT